MSYYLLALFYNKIRIAMTDVTEERKKVHAELRAELFKRQLSNSENFDKAILTYSSAGLALSLGFLKDFIPITQANTPCLLFLSWICFVLAVVITLLSFIFSQLGITKQLAINERYYIQMVDSALSEKNCFARFTDWCSYAAGTFFIIAIVCSTIFVSINLERITIMTNKKTSAPENHVLTPTILQSSQIEQRGAPVPGIQPVPQKTNQGTDSKVATDNAGVSANSGNIFSKKP